MTMGTMNKPSDTGYDGKDTGTVSRAAGPFNRPTNLAVGPKGDLYISDGYGNCRVHQFSPRGELKRSWGTRAVAPASSSCLTASPWPRTGASSCAIARTTASRSSAPTAST